MRKFIVFSIYSFSVAVLCLFSCRGPEVVPPSEEVPTGDSTEIPAPPDTLQKHIVGFYLLNEGNMGSNKATLDYYDFASGIYTRNIYASTNLNVAQSLGDVGNDLKIHGNRLYAVINCSNLIEVMTADSAKHIGYIEVPNCRYLAFKDGYGYVTSYAGPVSFDKKVAQIGYVAKFDTATLQIVDTCHVGYQPDGLEVAGDKLYVANSGGYMAPDYEHKLSVIDLNAFAVTNEIDVAINLQYVRTDPYGILWVSSRSDYFNEPSKLFCVDTRSGKKIADLEVPVLNMWLDGDSLYVIGAQFSYITFQEEKNYNIINVRTREIIKERFIPEDLDIAHPYGLMVHPETKDIFLTDAGDYVTPGILHCIDKDDRLKWSVRTGDIPAHMALLEK